MRFVHWYVTVIWHDYPTRWPGWVALIATALLLSALFNWWRYA